MRWLALVLALAGCARHVSVEQCMSVHLRESKCESPNRQLTDADRELLRGAFCDTEVDRDKLGCLDKSSCDAFLDCAYPHRTSGTPFGVPR